MGHGSLVVNDLLRFHIGKNVHNVERSVFTFERVIFGRLGGFFSDKKNIFHPVKKTFQ